MSMLKLTIVTPTGMIYEGNADRVMVRALLGDMAILPGHIDLSTALGNGNARITIDGIVRPAKIEGGLMHVTQNNVRILTNHFEWQEDAKNNKTV